MALADLEGSLVEGNGDGEHSRRQKLPVRRRNTTEKGGGVISARIEEHQSITEGPGAEGEIPHADDGDGPRQVLTASFGVEEGHAEVVAITQGEMDLRGLDDRGVEAMGSSDQLDVLKLKPAAAAAVTSLKEAPKDGLVDLEADRMVGDTGLDDKEPRGGIAMAGDRRKVAGRGIKYAVEGLVNSYLG